MEDVGPAAGVVKTAAGAPPAGHWERATVPVGRVTTGEEEEAKISMAAVEG